MRAAASSVDDGGRDGTLCFVDIYDVVAVAGYHLSFRLLYHQYQCSMFVVHDNASLEYIIYTLLGPAVLALQALDHLSVDLDRMLPRFLRLHESSITPSNLQHNGVCGKIPAAHSHHCLHWFPGRGKDIHNSVFAPPATQRLQSCTAQERVWRCPRCA